MKLVNEVHSLRLRKINVLPIPYLRSFKLIVIVDSTNFNYFLEFGIQNLTQLYNGWRLKKVAINRFLFW